MMATLSALKAETLIVTDVSNVEAVR